MTARSLAGLGSILIASACSHAPPPAPLSPIAGQIAFTAQSATDSIMVQGAFEGTAVIHDSWIDVVVTGIKLSFPPGPTERWRSTTLRAFLATDYGRGSWKAPVESRPSNVWRFLSFPLRPPPGRLPITIVEAHHFVVPIPPGTRLENARLAIEIEWVTVFHESEREFGETESNLAFSAAPLTAKPPTP